MPVLRCGSWLGAPRRLRQHVGALGDGDRLVLAVVDPDLHRPDDHEPTRLVEVGSGVEHLALSRAQEPDREVGGERHRLDTVDRGGGEIPEDEIGKAELHRSRYEAPGAKAVLVDLLLGQNMGG